jgi:hypothetical protein
MTGHKNYKSSEEELQSAKVDWKWYEHRLGRLTDMETSLIMSYAAEGLSDTEILQEILYDRLGDSTDYFWDRDIGDYTDTQVDHGEQNVWTADTGLIEPCAIAGKVSIRIPLSVWRQIVAMTDSTSSEWLGYLDYTVEGNRINVTSMSIPEQDVTSTEVVPLEPQTGKGVIHAHPGGGVPSFSGTDDKTLNPNNEFSIVISRDLRMTAVAKTKLPCGALSLVSADVSVEGAEPDTDFYVQHKPKLHEKTTKFATALGFGYSAGACHKRF